MSRNNQLLAVALIVQIALAAFLLWPRNNTVVASTLVSDVKLEELSKVSITGDQQTINMTKSGDTWVLPDRGDYAVLEPSVTDLISKVLTINTSRLVASNAANFVQLKVADNDFNRKIQFATSAGQNYTLLIGSSPNNRATNVRLLGQDQVYLTDKLSATDVNMAYSTYVNNAYFGADSERIAAISFSNGNGTLSARKDLSGTWQLEGLQAGETFSNTLFASLTSKLQSMTLVEPLGKDAKPEYGFANPQSIITVTVAPPVGITDTSVSAETSTILVGATISGTSNAYVKASNSEYYISMANFNLTDFIQKQRADYVAAAVFTPLLTGDSFTNTISSTITGSAPISEVAPISETAPVAEAEAITDTAPLTAMNELTATEAVTP